MDLHNPYVVGTMDEMAIPMAAKGLEVGLVGYSDTQYTVVPPPPPPGRTWATTQTCVPRLSYVRFLGDYHVTHSTLEDEKTRAPLPGSPTGDIPVAQIALFTCSKRLHLGHVTLFWPATKDKLKDP